MDGCRHPSKYSENQRVQPSPNSMLWLNNSFHNGKPGRFKVQRPNGWSNLKQQPILMLRPCQKKIDVSKKCAIEGLV